jgi:imidazolonepropionase
VATNCNPGSSPTSSMPFVIALARRMLRLTMDQAITATTAGPAALLGFPDRGRLAPGLRADLVVLRHSDERQLGYELGGNPVDAVIAGGRLRPA